NVDVSGQSLAQWAVVGLDPFGHLFGLDGAVMLAYIVAIPANEIVVPTLMMIYAKTGMMMDESGYEAIRHLLVDQNGWTLLTAVSLMLFSLLHNPCGSTILTIWKETKSMRWTLLGTFIPLGVAFLVCFAVANIARLLGA